MANVQNLQPSVYKFTQEDHKKAVKASAEARRKKKSMKECAQVLLQLDIKSDKTRKALKHLGIEDDDMINNMALITKLFQMSIEGNLQAFDRLQSVAGESVSTKIQIEDTRPRNPFEDMSTDELREFLKDDGGTTSKETS